MLFTLDNKKKNHVKIIEKKTMYQGFFRLDRYLLQHRLFNGEFSPPLEREVFERGSAAAALLYDPVLDKLVLIEQFRVGALTDPESPWLIETVAGVLKPNEDPKDLIVRETMEEAGLVILDLHFIYHYWVSPGASTEQITLFCAKVDATQAAGIHGLVEEGEDIRSIVISPSEAFIALEKGYIKNAPTIISLQWLQMHKSVLQKKWLG
jgi:ADP-ribose pyrophosphatase